MKIFSKTDYTKIAIVSYTILFGELLLIRLVGTEIRIFAYLSNIVLLSIFIGSGIGMFLKKKFPVFFSLKLIPFTVILIFFGKYLRISDLLSPINESFIWFGSENLNPVKTWSFTIVGFFLTMLIFILLMLLFVPLGQYLGNLFSKTKNIKIAYSVNIIFSLLGIWSFYALSFLSINPYLCIAFLSGLLLLILDKKNLKPGFVVFTVTLLISILVFSTQKSVVWSPYQKLQLKTVPEGENLPEGKILLVNNVGYMGLLDFSSDYQKRTEKYIDSLKSKNELPNDFVIFNQYDVPFLLHPDAQKVLIIGAGAGNDAAGSLRSGVSEIDAVEIDPQIIKIGKSHHPEKPYDNKKIKIYVNDGRSFLRKTNEKYDMVIMGLADSHTLNSNMTNVQLDNYLYTLESMQEIKNVLKDDGVFYISFEVLKPWIGSRIQKNITLAFNEAPTIFDLPEEPKVYGWGGTIFAVKKSGDFGAVLVNNEKLNRLITQRKIQFEDTQKILTDNWPYLYLDTPRIPKIHLILSAILLGGFYFLSKKLGFSKNFNLPAFFLGVGFLLYEFQNISRTSLLYGNTWVTNVFIISAILILILMANLISLKTKISLKYLYFFLVVSFGMQFAVPLSFLNNFSDLIKYTLVPVFLNSPLLFSGLIFIQLFSSAKEKGSFFASNLIGSAVGGVMSFFSYLMGIQFLIIVSLGFYMLAYVFSINTNKWFGKCKLLSFLNR